SGQVRAPASADEAMGTAIMPDPSALPRTSGIRERRGSGTMTASMQARRWRIGVDLGGTWLRVVAVREGARPQRFTAPTPGPAALARALRRLWARWRLSRGRVDLLLVASRGTWTAGERRRLAVRLRPLARVVRVMSDVE